MALKVKNTTTAMLAVPVAGAVVYMQPGQTYGPYEGPLALNNGRTRLMINKGMLVTHEVPDKAPDPPAPTPPPLPSDKATDADKGKTKAKKNQ